MIIETSAIIAVIVGISEAVKHAGFPHKWVPLLNIALGVAAMLFLNQDVPAINAWNGILMGLTACGLYSGVKNMSEMFKR